ncbi:hypothetical protein Q9L58_003985 [Maublancomyces gigas]|uniref:Aminoglycoside phosphotransferase domain-containing protein n=1 Tax=Discina gigas TaxID=1032678 RepID=A0ABR3GM49_9PEZI
MSRTLFPRISFACRVLLASSPHQRRHLSTFDVIRRVLIGSPAHELFSPTNDRWLWDEKRQRARHTRTFNIPALKATAAEALGVARWRVRLIKRGDGGSNKIIGAWGGGDRWVIIKLPDPVVPARVVTASEVALMEFVRTELGILAPKVLKWSWDAGGPVGAEYIIMEEVEEEIAGVRWSEIGLEGKARALKELLVVDEKFLRSSDIFKDVGYGSLYFTEDAEKLGFKKVFEVKSGRSPGRFCLGPLAERHFWVDAAADIDRGPWSTAQAYLTSIADASLHRLAPRGEPTARTKPFIINCRLASDQICPTAHTTLLLNRFHSLAPGLVHPTLSAPTLWHRDLSHQNIFVSSTGSISSIIDWQGVHILPLFLQARIPRLFRYKHSDPEVVPDPLSPLEDGFLDEENLAVQERIELIALAALYVDRLCAVSGELGDELRSVLEKQRIPMSRKMSVSVATSSFETSDDTLLLWGLLERVIREWEKIAPGTECPSKPAEGEVALLRGLTEYRNFWLDLLDMHEMPMGDDVSVTAENFESEKAKVKEFVRKLLMDGLEGDECIEQRERFIRHLKSWDLTDWNDGEGWIDEVGEKLSAGGPA